MTDRNSAIPFVHSGSFPVREGNHIRPLIDGIPAFRRISEALEAATERVWVTITFLWPEFQMPDGRGSVWDLFDKAAARGVDVRIIFWRPDAETDSWRENAFWGSEEHIQFLGERGSGVKIRWDRAHPGFCQHQKSWLIDAGTNSEVAFVGGINLNPHSVANPGHDGEGQNHDVYLEVAGPSTVDVHHNFVQRWNEASESQIEGGSWGLVDIADLELPTQIPEIRGTVIAQVQRTVPAGRYIAAIPAGEQTLFDQYCTAIDAAKRTIYLENQYLTVKEIVRRILEALKRGVEVVLLSPALADPHFRSVAEAQPEFYADWVELQRFDNFTLASIAGRGADGRRKPIYVHSKIMIVDNEWATIGSSNLHRFSLFGNGEMNVSFRDKDVVGAFRSELFQEHLEIDTSTLEDHKALHMFRRVANTNRARHEAGETNWQGLAIALDATRYGFDPDPF